MQQSISGLRGCIGRAAARVAKSRPWRALRFA
jgi:hypothetical protein